MFYYGPVMVRPINYINKYNPVNNIIRENKMVLYLERMLSLLNPWLDQFNSSNQTDSSEKSWLNILLKKWSSAEQSMSSTTTERIQLELAERTLSTIPYIFEKIWSRRGGKNIYDIFRFKILFYSTSATICLL
jgi:hypothetical protein